jgi:hypothetical protein
VKLCWIFSLSTSLLLAQTRVDLRTQGKDIDFSAAASVKPAPVGAVLPATCTTGEQFFLSGAQPGANLYGCVATNTWTLESNGGVSAAFTDLQASSNASTLTVAAGRADFNVNGLPMAIQFGPATIVRNSGTDSGTFLVFADYNAGAPALRCSITAGINISSYTVSSGFAGSTCTAGSAFPAHTIPVALMDVALGVMQPVQDLRTPLAREPLLAGGGLSIAGNLISLGNGIATGGVKRIPYASLPACTQSELNVQYLFIDGNGLSAQCDGASEMYFYNNQPVTPTGLVSGYTKVNATGGSTVSDDHAALYVQAVSTTAGNNLVTALKSLNGATDIRAAVVFASPGADFNSCGLLLADGTATSNKVTLFGRLAQSNGWVAQFGNYTNYTTLGTGTVQRASAVSATPVWLRIVLSGGNQVFYVSGDGGATWQQFGSQTAFETATHYGIGCDAGGTGTPAAMLVVSLSAQ